MNTENFTGKAEAYAKGRPGYPKAAIETIVGLAYIASQDDNPLPNDPGYEAHMSAINAVFERDSVDGLLHLDRVTKVYCERIE